MNNFENINYYGIAFDKFEILDFKTDFLAGVRANYFNSGLSPQKERSLQYLDRDTYFFNYSVENGVNAQWVLKKNAQLVQKSCEIDGNCYCVESYYENDFIYKKSYFDNNHNWLKTEYFSVESDSLAYCLKNTVYQGQFAIEKTEYNQQKELVTYLFPKMESPENREYSVLAYTDKGFLYFNTVPNKDNSNDFNNEIRKPVVGFFFNLEDFSADKGECGFSICDADYLNYEPVVEDASINIDVLEENTDSYEEVITTEKPEISVVENVLPLSVEAEEPEKINFIDFQETPDSVVISGGDEYNYYGEVSDGKRNGYGRTVTQQGITAYEGNYVNDKRNGFGSFYCKNGDLNFVGNWLDNSRQGFGVGFRSTDFTAHIGKWNKNTPDGIGARFDREGNFMFLGEFVNGKKQGLGISFDENAGFIVSKFEDDKVISSHLLNDILPDAE